MWRISPVEGQTDELGWQYSTDFVYGNTGWTAHCGPISLVRRRCWQPSFYSDPANGESGKKRASTTLLQTKAKGASQIYDAVVGSFSLEELAETLESEDWQAPGSLMSMYWKEMGSTNLEIGGWTDGATFATPVQGKVRSIEMKTLVPPAPMCPKETRAQSTWHVVVLEDRVVLESVTMSLDVPCGTNFYVIVCDTFTCVEGKVNMVRTCGVEWVQQTWLKTMVEQNVPIELAKVGARMANVIGEWAKQNKVKDSKS